MKAYFYQPFIKPDKVAILLFILVLIQACSSTRYISDDQAIVKKVTIDSINPKLEEEAFNYVQKDIRPAAAFSINVPLYNIFNTKDGRYKTSNIKPFGSPPAILDSTLVEISRNQIEKFLKGKGYFTAKVEANISVEDKKARVAFKAKSGPAYFIGEITDSISNQNIKQLYNSKKSQFSHLHTGMQYDADSLTYEREQIYRIAKENGYYFFLRPYINFDVRGADVISLENTNKISLQLNITNPPNGEHKTFEIGTTQVIVSPNADGFPDSVRYKLSKDTVNHIVFTDFAKRYRRNPIVRYSFLKYGDIYNIRNENITYDRLYQLNIFKNVNINFFRADSTSNKIIPVIQLIPQKVMSNRIEGEVPFNGGTVGFNLSNTYTNSNIFRGAERFELQLKGGLQSRIGNGETPFKDIYQRDFSISASIAVPRLLIPFFEFGIGKNGLPHTTFSSSYIYALQKDISVRRIFINSVTYDWVETKSKLHSLTPLNFEYRFGNLNRDSLTSDVALNNLYYIALLDRKDFTLGTKYTYSLNADRLSEYRSFTYFRGNIETAGNLLQAATSISGQKRNVANGEFATFLGLPYNQYVRPDVDIRIYRDLSDEKQFIARLNVGVGFAYGNSDRAGLPFEKKFFAGGSSGVRAWQARTLGPGNYNRVTLGNDELRRALFGLDQLGDLRIESNFEYRYTLLNKFLGAKLKGAVFLDAGNVWNLTAADGEEKKINFGKLGQQIAIGTGLGFRYDVKFFVFRFDVGLKLKDPQFVGSEQWVIRKFISGGSAFKSDYNATHGPDSYRFIQYNFGIGMPF